MRDIGKYRGMCAGHWRYGYLTQSYGNMVIQEPIDVNDQQPFGNGYKQFIVHPDTVGEYTGLKDKNGAKIYEGDRVKSTVGWTAEIEFSNGSFGYHDDIQWLALCVWSNLCFLEVIGTIHDKEAK